MKGSITITAQPHSGAMLSACFPHLLFLVLPHLWDHWDQPYPKISLLSCFQVIAKDMMVITKTPRFTKMTISIAIPNRSANRSCSYSRTSNCSSNTLMTMVCCKIYYHHFQANKSNELPITMLNFIFVGINFDA